MRRTLHQVGGRLAAVQVGVTSGSTITERRDALSSTDSSTSNVVTAIGPLPSVGGAARQPAGLEQALVLALATIAEPGEAGHHIQRIRLYVRALACRLRRAQTYADLWRGDTLDALVQASALHDIGNSAVPDRILLKPGALMQDELDTMRSHAVIGRDIIDQIQRGTGTPSEFLGLAREIAHGHHERWDGKGYPRGLAGDAIPVSAQVVTVADSYDALTSDRVYRAGIAHDKAIQLLFHERGEQLAPDVVDALIEVHHEFADIARQFADSETDLQKRVDYMARAIAENP
jgi:putative two-component system response regulator